ncbi:Yip1 family protein [Sulfitobacter sp. S190]|uniref:Yip1 family protein n=1 Tax=Sulfitobacter sp. S190 TaxID=2867022 RepID=UPI0021A96583|nr:Yip1 family protein [Sulfitobacter sp. S190]UWR23975.1 YIP1 family protein [Sulfitobacter sp. S190]
MMDLAFLTDLAMETLRAPRSAAERIIGLYLDRTTLWTALALCSVLYILSIALTTLQGPRVAELPQFFYEPLIFFFLWTGLLVLAVHALYWTARTMGGEGDFGDLLAVMTWLQAMRVAAQVILTVLALVSPILALLFSAAAGVIGFWIMLNFITVSMRLPSNFHSLGVLVLAIVGLFFGIIILGGVVGLATLGVPANV